MDNNKVIADLRSLHVPMHRRIRVWKPFMQKYNIQKLCEVGVQHGRNFLLMADHNPQLAVAIDPWIKSANVSGYTQVELDDQYLKLIELSKEKKFIKIIRDFSFNAYKEFSDNYFDLIYIDADHTYEAVLTDLNNWFPKVKKNGFLAGDDYVKITKQKFGKTVKFGVIEAVDEFALKNNLTVYQIPGFNWVIIKQ